MQEQTLSEALNQILTKKLKSTTLLVIYDKFGSFESIIHKSVPPNIKLIKYTGSELEIRFKIEKESNLGDSRIIYLPKTPESRSWLKDYELMGEKIELDVIKILSNEFDIEINPEILHLLTPNNCRKLSERWDVVLGSVRSPLSKNQLEEALITAVLNVPSKFNVEQIIFHILEEPEITSETLVRNNLEKAFIQILEKNGLPRFDNINLDLISSSILLSEIFSKTQLDDSKYVDILPKNEYRHKWNIFSKNWSQNLEHKESFLSYSEKVEKQYQLDKLLVGVENIEKLDNFKIVDKILLDEIIGRTDNTIDSIYDNLNYIKKISEQRNNNLWVKEEIIFEWPILETLAHLLNKIKKYDYNKIVNHYYDEGWKIDYYYRMMSMNLDKLNRNIINKLIIPTNKEYQKWLKKINIKFANHYEDKVIFPLDESLNPINFWERHVETDKKIIIFYLDSLRLELLNSINQQLKKSGNKIEFIKATSLIPSTTVVNFAALLPNKEIRIDKPKNDIEIFIDKTKIKTKQDRVKYIKNKYKEKTSFLEINELRDNLKSINKKIKDANIIIVYDNQIDKAGHFIETNLLDYFNNQIERILSAINSSILLGPQKIYILTDHGFLFIPNTESVEKIDFNFKQYYGSKRYQIGQNQKSDRTISIPLEEMGINSDLFVHVPKGIGYFRTSGSNDSFIHGGLSLQECCIGYLVITPDQKGQKITVKAEYPEKISSTIVKVTLSPQSSAPIPIYRTIRVELLNKKEIIGNSEDIAIEQKEEIYIPLRKISGIKSLTLRITDIYTREILHQKEITISLPEYGDDLFP